MSNESLKLSSAEMAKKVEEFQEWINNEPDLPRNIEKHLLLRYLKTYNFNVEKAQTLLKFSFGLRQKNKIIFTNRDFMSPEIQKVLNYCEMVPMFKATPENYKCCINRLVDYSTEGYNFNDLIKTFFMVADVRLVSPDPNPEKMADGEVPIFDMKGLTVWHLLKITFSTMKLYFKYAQEAHPVRVQQIHVCNCTPLISRVMSLIKPLLKPEVAERFQFHTPDSETIFEFIPREMLPEEYGGKAGPISVMKEFWLKKFYENRDYIKNDANWIVSGREEDHNNNSEQQIK